MMVCLLIASSGEPLRIVKGGDPGAAPLDWWVAAVCGAIAVATLAAAVAYAVRARQAKDAREEAFRRTARSLGVSRRVSRLVHRIAQSHGAASPVALLVSEHAMRTAIAAFERNGLTAADGKLLTRLRRDLGL
jgi:hypothetical protein